MSSLKFKTPPIRRAETSDRVIRGPFERPTASSREWIVTNGRGGFASATLTQALTRRYHGLLVAAIDPPVRRFVLLAKLDATALVGLRSYALGTNIYRDAIHPEGYAHIDAFIPGQSPIWHWRAGAALIEQRLCMIDGEDAVAVRYRLLEGESATMTVRPLGTSRHFHHLTSAGPQGTPTIERHEHFITLRWPGNLPDWSLHYTGRFERGEDWYYGFQLPIERDRGFDSIQDLYTPGTIVGDITNEEGSALYVGASTTETGSGAALWERAILGPALHRPKPRRVRRRGRAGVSRRTPTVLEPGATHPPRRRRSNACPYTLFAERLADSARHFIVTRDHDLKTIIAGYPWFGDWGRDTFIALPGLCLATGRYGDARRIIRAFATHVSEGMIPNRFPPYGEPPQYNTCDATLWYVHAMDAYVRHTKDWAFIGETMYPTVRSIIEHHVAGTRYGIRVDRDGLLAAGEPGVALTWMDAKVGDRVFTPRIGKPVEINALWYNALSIAMEFAVHARDGIRAKQWCDLAARCRESFNRRFWNNATGCLHDIVDADHHSGRDDATIRPNQLLAISLPHDVLDHARWDSVVNVCDRELLTPMGLRTQSRGDANYHPLYRGNSLSRDEAYHQGTVWPWLIGPFITALVRTRGSDAIPNGKSMLDGLMAHFDQSGVDGISEVADGDAPHAPGGCPWQAWSVAEPLRVLVDDLGIVLETAVQD